VKLGLTVPLCYLCTSWYVSNLKMRVSDGPEMIHSSSDESESEDEKLDINFDLSLPGAHSVSKHPT